MLNNLKKIFQGSKASELNIKAAVSGQVINLENCGDPVFESKSLGDGVAIIPSDDIVYAPCDGKVTLVHQSKHAIVITTKNGDDIMVHSGLDTVSLDGEPFEVYAAVGDTVTEGDKIQKMDRDIIAKNNLKDTVITVVMKNTYGVATALSNNTEVEGGKDNVMTLGGSGDLKK